MGTYGHCAVASADVWITLCVTKPLVSVQKDVLKPGMDPTAHNVCHLCLHIVVLSLRYMISIHICYVASVRYTTQL